ncbi:MAG: C40 family peptidase [Janthinobacterium lividum]
MRAIWLIFGGLLAAVVVGGWRYQHRAAPVACPSPPALPIMAVAERRFAPTPSPTTNDDERAAAIVQFALAQLGTQYCYAGTNPGTGFDCSGFVQYVFGHFAIPTPHSTALLIEVGRPVPRAQAQPGDIVVFTGTAAESTTPGHAGIIISALGETPLRFVHASSAKRESGVKISQVEGTDYARRFMQVRRVLAGGPANPIPTPSALPQAAAGVVAPLPLPPAKLAKVPALPLPPPVAPLPTRPWVRRSARTPVAAAQHRASPPTTAAHHQAASVRHQAKTRTRTRTVTTGMARPKKLVTKHKPK